MAFWRVSRHAGFQQQRQQQLVLNAVVAAAVTYAFHAVPCHVTHPVRLFCGLHMSADHNNYSLPAWLQAGNVCGSTDQLAVGQKAAVGWCCVRCGCCQLLRVYRPPSQQHDCVVCMLAWDSRWCVWGSLWVHSFWWGPSYKQAAAVHGLA